MPIWGYILIGIASATVFVMAYLAASRRKSNRSIESSLQEEGSPFPFGPVPSFVTVYAQMQEMVPFSETAVEKFGFVNFDVALTEIQRLTRDEIRYAVEFRVASVEKIEWKDPHGSGSEPYYNQTNFEIVVIPGIKQNTVAASPSIANSDTTG